MHRVVITGCSGGGKSTLVGELRQRGFATVGEPGRRVIASERASGGDGFPWENEARFSDLAFWMAVADHAGADGALTFFDRSALDQAAWYARTGSAPPGEVPVYDRDIFLVPPWREIFENDADRRHGFDDAVAEYSDLAARLPGWGYKTHIVARTTVAERADRVLEVVAKGAPCLSWSTHGSGSVRLPSP